MPPRFRKKVHNMRGYRRGYGSKKKHRGKGSKGGKGMGGSTKHKRSYIYAYDRQHFGYKGFHSLQKKEKAINVGELAQFGSDINLTELGYGKLLSKGAVTAALTVRVAACSPKAREKIEAAGGKIVSG